MVEIVERLRSNEQAQVQVAGLEAQWDTKLGFISALGYCFFACGTELSQGKWRDLRRACW